ncbi:MAG: diguanylate cyclase, partial [Gammaproteobacteria bacterium]|nr:diguanylate cyclase [Gammaproteobacteria bacterium]
MHRTRPPRYVVLSAALAVVVIASLSTVFYVQYRGLANSIVSLGVDQHEASVLAEFESRAARYVDQLAEQIAMTDEAPDALLPSIMASERSVENKLVALRMEKLGDSSAQIGIIPADLTESATNWRPNQLYVSRAVVRDGQPVGRLTAAFELRNVRNAMDTYRAELVSTEQRQTQLGYSWVVISILAMLLLCIGTIWLLVRSHHRRIRQLQTQVRKLTESDFGEPIPITANDPLGELAAFFNTMRDKLQETTISANYVDSVLANMNEAIIITSADGLIKRINKATSKLLGYTEDELIGMSIDKIVDNRKSGRLESSPRSNTPRETLLVSNAGKSIPVSYTSAAMDSGNGKAADIIYAAQNITERRKAEQRIRYLARIDALTKVPNRMQFQHLLQRAIARATRSKNALALLYIDIDHFKEINDTFGHLAGDATLETVAARLNKALPPESVIGRLAGDEFAVIVDRLESGTDMKTGVDSLARKLLDRLADPFFVQGHEVFMTASMGIAFFPVDAPNVIDLIRNADAALYHAKRSGGNIFSHY